MAPLSRQFHFLSWLFLIAPKMAVRLQGEGLVEDIFDANEQTSVQERAYTDAASGFHPESVGGPHSQATDAQKEVVSILLNANEQITMQFVVGEVHVVFTDSRLLMQQRSYPFSISYDELSAYEAVHNNDGTLFMLYTSINELPRVMIEMKSDAYKVNYILSTVLVMKQKVEQIPDNYYSAVAIPLASGNEAVDAVDALSKSGLLHPDENVMLAFKNGVDLLYVFTDKRVCQIKSSGTNTLSIPYAAVSTFTITRAGQGGNSHNIHLATTFSEVTSLEISLDALEEKTNLPLIYKAANLLASKVMPEYAGGQDSAPVCRQLGVSQQTWSQWMQNMADRTTDSVRDAIVGNVRYHLPGVLLPKETAQHAFMLKRDIILVLNSRIIKFDHYGSTVNPYVLLLLNNCNTEVFKQRLHVISIPWKSVSSSAMFFLKDTTLDRQLVRAKIQASSFDGKNTEIKFSIPNLLDGPPLEQTIAAHLSGPLPSTTGLDEALDSCISETNGFPLMKGEQKIAEGKAEEHVLILTTARLMYLRIGSRVRGCEEQWESFHWGSLRGVTISLDTASNIAHLTIRSSRDRWGTRSWAFKSSHEEYAQMVSGLKFSNIAGDALEVQRVPEWNTKAEVVLQGQSSGKLGGTFLEELESYEILRPGNLSGWVADNPSLVWVTSGDSLLTMRTKDRTISSSLINNKDAGAYWVRGPTGSGGEVTVQTTLYQAPLTFTAKNTMALDDVHGLLTFLKTVGN